MTKLSTKITATPYLWVGIGGNMYATCSDKEPLFDICDKVGKSKRAIYFSKTHQCWAIRCKSRKHKDKLATAMLNS